MEAYGCLSCYFGLLDGIYGNPSFTLEDAQLFICARDAEAQNLLSLLGLDGAEAGQQPP